MYFFSADQHFFHQNIIRYTDRPFKDVDEMNHTMILNHNEVVSDNDNVVHVGDFALAPKPQVDDIIRQLKGDHIFILGSHDRWLGNRYPIQLWERMIDDHCVVACHYAMRVWPKSHYGSWHVYGHSHGNLESLGKSYDVGVDNNNFYPVSFDQLKIIMDDQPVFNDCRDRKRY